MTLGFNKKSKKLLCIFSSMFFLSINSLANASSLNIDLNSSIDCNSHAEKVTNDNITNNAIDKNTKENNNYMDKTSIGDLNTNTLNTISSNETSNSNSIKAETTISLGSSAINTYEENNPFIKYYGNWITDDNSENSNGSSIYSDSSDAYMTFAFTGTGFSLYGYRNNSKGFATVNIDGVDHIVDIFSVAPQRQNEFFKITDLENTKHIIKIKVTHEKNNDSYGYYVNLDKIDIYDGELVQCYDTKSYEETDSRIKYYGDWITDKNVENSGYSSIYSNSPNAYMTFAFTGTGFSLYGYRNNSKGFATINIDGVDHVIDTFSKYPKREAEFFQIDNLSDTKHVVKIKIAHEKNDDSYEYYVNLDKIDIHDGELVPIYESNIYEEDYSYIDYFGNWVTDDNPSNSNGSARFSDSLNSCITFQFKGTGFAWYGYANNSKGIANIYIDDKKIQYDTFFNDPAYQHLFFEKENLENTNHIVRIEVSGEKNSQSYGPYLNFDKLEIYEGELVPICPEISTYQDDNLRLIYNGNWTKEIDALNSNQSARHSGNTGDYITFAFNGTGFKWYEYANNSKGIANVYIDDEKPFSVDTYTKETNYQYPVFEINNLENKRHVVKIEVSGNKNTNSFGKYINIDRIDIFNGIMKSLFPNNYYEEDNSLIEYNGYWITDSDSRNSSSNAKFSNTQGSSVTFSFNGNGFRWYGYGNNSKGIAKIYIDGKEYNKDTYQSYIQYQCPFFEILFDEKGKHSVTIKVSGTQNELSYGSYINLDNLEIFNGNLISNDDINTYEETDPLIQFNGNWTSDEISKSSDLKGDSINFNFKGTGFVWYGYANNSKGYAEVYIDNEKVADVNTYSQKQDYQHPFYKIDSLDNTEHTVEIKVVGEKDPSSYGYYINFDRLDIYDGELID